MYSQDTKRSGHCETVTSIPFTGTTFVNLGSGIILPLQSPHDLVDRDDGLQSTSLPRAQSCHQLRSKPCHSYIHHVTHRRTNPISFTREHPPSPCLTSHTFPTAPYVGEGQLSIFAALGLPPEEEIRVNLSSERCQYELGSYDDPWIKAHITKSSFYNCEDHDFELNLLLSGDN